MHRFCCSQSEWCLESKPQMPQHAHVEDDREAPHRTHQPRVFCTSRAIPICPLKNCRQAEAVVPGLVASEQRDSRQHPLNVSFLLDGGLRIVSSG